VGRSIGSSLRGAALRLCVGLGLVALIAAVVAVPLQDGAGWPVLVLVIGGYVAIGFVDRGAATLLDAARFRVRVARGAVPPSGSHRLVVRDVSRMTRVRALRVLRASGLTPGRAGETVDKGTQYFASEPIAHRVAEQVARAARRYGAEARSEPVELDQPVAP